MTKEEIQQHVAAIKGLSGDFEAAHSQEDKLYEKFIQYVADTHTGKLGEMATEVLKTKKIKFDRHCA